jgi:hypothetical protein
VNWSSDFTKTSLLSSIFESMNTIQRKMVPKLHPGRFFMKLRSPFFVQSMYQAVQMKPTLEALKLTNEKEKKNYTAKPRSFQ